MKNTPKIMQYVLWSAIGIFFVWILFGCSTTNKTKSVHKEVVDSSSVTKIDSNVNKKVDSTNVKNSNTVTIKETDGNFEKETVIEFNSPDTSNKEAKPTVKKITVKEKGITKSKEVKTENNKDSTKLVRTENTDLNKEVATDLHKNTFDKDKTVKRTSYTGMVIGFSLLALLLLVAYYYRKKIAKFFA